MVATIMVVMVVEASKARYDGGGCASGGSGDD